MKDKIKLINNRLKTLIAAANKNAYHKKLFKAANYSLLSKGKRIRPLLLLLTVEAFKKDIKPAIDPACALEMIHTYSLIHDDLPCMDDDDYRRGKPTLHKAYSESTAILTGDFFLTYAFEIIANSKKLTCFQKIKLIQILAKYSGGNGLIAGQVADLSWENKKIDFQKLKFMHLNKTASLFIAAIELACIIVNATKTITSKFVSFAKDIGLAFQIADDIDDLKNTKSSDSSKNKSTAVTILGIDKAKKFATDLYEEALKNLKSINLSTNQLENLVKKLFKKS